MAAALRILLFASGLLLAGCGEEEHSDDPGEAIAPQVDAAAGAWLRATDRIDPAVWLAGRERGRPLAETDPAVEEMRRALRAARNHFLESERMLANRTAQLGRMLADDGRPEGYVALLGALSNVAAAAGTKQAYGEICQHYFNLRHSGVERDVVLGTLSARYRSQREFR